jgi:hypothetical protein
VRHAIWYAGALGIDLHYKPDRHDNRTAKFLGVVGSMIAQAMKTRWLIEADRQRLVDENTHLRFEPEDRYGGGRGSRGLSKDLP